MPIIWAMRVNRFFSSAVRIQFDRGQRAISDGPYRFVRHPGYTAALVLIVANGVALGSWLAAATSWIGIPILLWRTEMEDWMLHAELPGVWTLPFGSRHTPSAKSIYSFQKR